jgi:uncharacterized protein YukE
MTQPEAIEVDPSGVHSAATVVAGATAALRGARSRLATAALLGGGTSSTIAAANAAVTTWSAYVDEVSHRLDDLAAGLREAATRYTQCDAAASERFCSTWRDR